MTAPSGKQEQRLHERIQVYQSTFFRASEPQVLHDCLIHDLSEGGILFETKEALAPLDRIMVAIRYGKKICNEEVEIVRATRLISLRYGARFHTEAHAATRREWLAELRGGS